MFLQSYNFVEYQGNVPRLDLIFQSHFCALSCSLLGTYLCIQAAILGRQSVFPCHFTMRMSRGQAPAAAYILPSADP